MQNSYETPAGTSIATVDDSSLHVMIVGNVTYIDIVSVPASNNAVRDSDIVTSIQLTDDQRARLREAL